MFDPVLGPTPPADETVGLLVNAGLFDSAVNICKLYKMSFTTVFEGLASRSARQLSALFVRWFFIADFFFRNVFFVRGHMLLESFADKCLLNTYHTANKPGIHTNQHLVHVHVTKLNAVKYV